MATDASAASAPGATLVDAVPTRRYRRPSMWRAIRKQRLALTGAMIIALFSVVAIIGPTVAPHGKTEQFIADRLQGPSDRYPLGTDEFGRDVLSRLLHGARISFQVGAIVVGLAGTTGVLLGLFARYRGGWLDNIVTLLMDIVYAFPAVLLAIAIITLLGNSLTNAIMAISIVYLPPFVRVVRGASITVRHTAYVEAARSLGAGTPRILARHVFPNITAPLIVQTSLSFAF